MTIRWLPGVLILPPALIVTFFGYRLLRFTLVVLGFGLGAYLGWLLTTRLAAANWLVLTAALILGIGLALLLVWLFRLGVFLVGAVAGALLTLIIARGGYVVLMAVIGGLAGGILALLLQRPVLSLLTAFVGAWGVVAGFFSLFGQTRLRLGTGVELPLLAILWLGLGGLGFLVQMIKTGRKRGG